MMINEKKPEMDREKEVKIKIPLTYHVKLHSMKVLTGKQISDTVTEALEAYFRHHAEQRAAHDLSPGMPAPSFDLAI